MLKRHTMSQRDTHNVTETSTQCHRDRHTMSQRETHNVKEAHNVTDRGTRFTALVSWCFEPSQPHRETNNVTERDTQCHRETHNVTERQRERHTMSQRITHTVTERDDVR